MAEKTDSTKKRNQLGQREFVALVEFLKANVARHRKEGPTFAAVAAEATKAITGGEGREVVITEHNVAGVVDKWPELRWEAKSGPAAHPGTADLYRKLRVVARELVNLQRQLGNAPAADLLAVAGQVPAIERAVADVVDKGLAAAASRAAAAHAEGLFGKGGGHQ